jgi:hypothetical protein
MIIHLEAIYMSHQSSPEEILCQLEEVYLTALREDNLTAALKSVELKIKCLAAQGKGQEAFSLADLGDEDIERLIAELG